MPANDRARLERLCRYVARPPLASDRLERGPEGRLVYRLRHRWRDGTTHVLFEPLELLERLAALVPPPRFNLVRYHGVLGPAASHRKTVVAGASAPQSSAPAADDAAAGARTNDRGHVAQGAVGAAVAMGAPHETGQDPGRPEGRPCPTPAAPSGGHAAVRTPARDVDRRRRYEWAELMRRVFAVDVLECPRCSGPMRILAAIHPPTATRDILECLGLPSRAPPVAPAPPTAGIDAPTGEFEADFGP